MQKNKLIKITDKEYFSADGLSSSGLKQFRKSPAHYQAYLNEPNEWKKAYREGSVCHAKVLEGIEPKLIKSMPMKSDADKQIMKDFFKRNLTESDFSEIFTTEKATAKQRDIAFERGDFYSEYDFDKIIKMSKSVKAHGYGKFLGRDPKRSELAGFAEDPETGLLLKAKFDYAPATGTILFDLKTCVDASTREFKRSIKKFGYDIQACHYMNVARLCGMDYNTFVFIAVEKSSPYGTNAITLDYESMEIAENKYRLLLEDFKECKKNDDFSRCYGNELNEVEL